MQSPLRGRQGGCTACNGPRGFAFAVLPKFYQAANKRTEDETISGTELRAVPFEALYNITRLREGPVPVRTWDEFFAPTRKSVPAACFLMSNCKPRPTPPQFHCETRVDNFDQSHEVLCGRGGRARARAWDGGKALYCLCDLGCCAGEQWGARYIVTRSNALLFPHSLGDRVERISFVVQLFFGEGLSPLDPPPPP